TATTRPTRWRTATTRRVASCPSTTSSGGRCSSAGRPTAGPGSRTTRPPSTAWTARRDVAVVDPTLEFEAALLASGARYVIGCDEVGRGAIAGPVAVGVAVVAADS